MTGCRPAPAVPLPPFLLRLYGTYCVSNASMGILYALETGGWPPALLPALLFGVYWALMGQILTPILLVHLLLGGPPVVSHDVVPQSIVGPGVLGVILLLLAGALRSRASSAGRWLSHACVAALTLAVGIDLLGWMRQGL